MSSAALLLGASPFFFSFFFFPVSHRFIESCCMEDSVWSVTRGATNNNVTSPPPIEPQLLAKGKRKDKFGSFLLRNLPPLPTEPESDSTTRSKTTLLHNGQLVCGSVRTVRGVEQSVSYPSIDRILPLITPKPVLNCSSTSGSGIRSNNNSTSVKRNPSDEKRDLSHYLRGAAAMSFMDTAMPRLSLNATRREIEVNQRKQRVFEEDYSRKLADLYQHEAKLIQSEKNRCVRGIDERMRQWVMLIALANSIQHFGTLRKKQRAQKTLKSLFVLRFIKYIEVRRARRKRNVWMDERLKAMTSRPNLADNKNCVLLGKLPPNTLQYLTNALVPRCHKEGEVIFQAGQRGQECFILDSGEVEQLPQAQTSDNVDKQQPSKCGLNIGRSAKSENSNSSFSSCQSMKILKCPMIITQKGYIFGKTMLLTEEPYANTGVAKTDCCLWVLTRTVFQEEIARLPPSGVGEWVQRLIDERRRTNMTNFNKLSEETFRRMSPIFKEWSKEGVHRILGCLSPDIFRKGEVLVEAGAYGKTVFFIVSGRVEILADGKRVETIKEGSAFGELVALLQEKKANISVRATQHCDVWLLRREDLVEIVCHEQPLMIMQAVSAMQEAIAAKEKAHQQRKEQQQQQQQPQTAQA